MEHDDIDELFSELKKESLAKYTAQNIKPTYIELKSGRRAHRRLQLRQLS